MGPVLPLGEYVNFLATVHAGSGVITLSCFTTDTVVVLAGHILMLCATLYGAPKAGYAVEFTAVVISATAAPSFATDIVALAGNVLMLCA